MDKITRRKFVRNMALGTIVTSIPLVSYATKALNKKNPTPGKNMSKIITVNGEIDSKELGWTLPHEHIMVDFIGAAKSGKHRYHPPDVIQTMLPYLRELPKRNISAFVDCTPMYLGRDVLILKELSRLSGLHIITNTGQYKEPYLPEKSFSMSSEEIAGEWILEFEKGIENTSIRPGFIKTAVNPAPLNEIEKKIISAAALTSKQTGLTIATHCVKAVAAYDVLKILDSNQISPQKWIFVHAQEEENTKDLIQIANTGSWIELDSVGQGTEEKNLKPLLDLIEKGLIHRVLLSQDSGWYNIGVDKGGQIKPFTYLSDHFLPLLLKKGITQSMISQLMVQNPANAYSIS